MIENKNITNYLKLSFRTIVTPMTRHPENLEVNCFSVDGKVAVEARFHFADHGNILGKKRVNFEAVESIMVLIGNRLGVPVKLNNLLTPNVGGEEPFAPTKYVKDWPMQKTMDELAKVLEMFLQRPFDIQPVHDEAESKTEFRILISKKENPPISVGQAAFSLSKIFHAIGKSRGRFVSVKGVETNV